MHATIIWLAALLAALSPADGEGQVRSSSTGALTLQQLLRDVLSTHPLANAAAGRVRAAQASRRTAGAWPNPTLAYQVENAALPGGIAPPMDREAMTIAMLPLHSLYQRWPRVARAEAEVASADAEAARQRQEVALAAARAFYRTALAHIGAEAARDLVTWLDSIVAYNRVRVAEGVAAEADLIRSELERDRAAAEEAMQMVELVRALAELKSFISDTTARIVFDTIPLPVAPGQLRAPNIDERISARPDVRAVRSRAQAAAAGTRAERTMIVGDVDATFGVKRSAGFSSLIAGASISLPLFNQNRGEIARASAERDVATFELAAVERAARAELQAAAEANRLLTERATALARGFLARADEARAVTLGAYREGAVPLFQVIDASRAWGEARRTYYQTVFAQHESVLALFVAQGGDLAAWTPLQNR